MARPYTMRPAWIALACIAVLGGAARAADPDGEIRELRKQVDELLRRDTEKQRRIEELERRLGSPAAAAAPAPTTAGSAAEALDRAVEEATGAAPAPSAAPEIASRAVGPATLRLLDLSLDALVAAGGSTEGDEIIETLQGGGHDPKRTASRVQNAELSAMGAVDPYLTGEAHIILPRAGEQRIGRRARRGVRSPRRACRTGCRSRPGTSSPSSAASTRRIRTPGSGSTSRSSTLAFRRRRAPQPRLPRRLALPLPWFSQTPLSARKMHGEAMRASSAARSRTSGRGRRSARSPRQPHRVPEHAEERRRARGEEHVERARHRRPPDRRAQRPRPGRLPLPGALGERPRRSSDDWSRRSSASRASSGRTLPATTARTRIYGTDLVVKWRPADNFRGWPFLLVGDRGHAPRLRGRRFFVRRRSRSRPRQDDASRLGLLHAGSSTASPTAGPAACARIRQRRAARARKPAATPIRSATIASAYRRSYLGDPSEFSRLRLQYNFDRRRSPRRRRPLVWLGLEILYGVHPAHPTERILVRPLDDAIAFLARASGLLALLLRRRRRGRRAAARLRHRSRTSATSRARSAATTSTVTVFAKGTEDAHFVEATPSFVQALADADLYWRRPRSRDRLAAAAARRRAQRGRSCPAARAISTPATASRRSSPLRATQSTVRWATSIRSATRTTSRPA